MCANPFKIVKSIFSPPKPQAPTVIVNDPGPDPKTMQEIQQQRDELNRQREELLNQQRQFNQDMAKWTQEMQQKAVPAPITAIAPTTNRQSTPQTSSEDEAALNSRRRGRSSLRIPLASSNAGAGGTGLNVPRG